MLSDEVMEDKFESDSKSGGCVKSCGPKIATELMFCFLPKTFQVLKTWKV